MSKFFVGQRVKKVRGIVNVGSTGTVLALGSFTHDDEGHSFAGGMVADMELRHDAPWRNTEGHIQPASATCFGLQDNYEPIVPEGMQPVEWSQCLWQPEHLREAA